MYLGMAAFLFGVGIFLGTLSSFSGTVLFIIAMEIFFIPDEEKAMRQAFGAEFENYKSRVRRWI
jgi:protein-S-isoprenylcysteine O-methyltransferase Ste14